MSRVRLFSKATGYLEMKGVKRKRWDHCPMWPALGSRQVTKLPWIPVFSSLRPERIKPLCSSELGESLPPCHPPVLDLRPSLLLNMFPRAVDGELKVPAHKIFISIIIFVTFSYKCKRKCTSYIVIHYLWFYPKEQAYRADSDEHKYISKPMRSLTRCQGAPLHTALQGNGKPSAPSTLASHLGSPEGSRFGWHILITSTFLLLIKPSHFTLTVFHLRFILQFPPFSPPWSQSLFPAISLKCLGKKLFSSLIRTYSCYKFHPWLPTDFQVTVSPWSDSFSGSQLLSFLPLWSCICFNNFSSLSTQKDKFLLKPLSVSVHSV